MPAAHPASPAAPANTGGRAATSASESSEKRQYSATGLNTILVTGSEADRDGTSITSELRASRDPMNGISRGYLKPHPVVPKSAPEGDGLVVQGQVSLT